MNNHLPYYKAIGKEIEVFEQTYLNKIPFLLKGPTGTGKSRFIEFMAHKLGKELITISCHEETSSTDLTGRFITKGAETVWLDGPLTTAVKEKDGLEKSQEWVGLEKPLWIKWNLLSRNGKKKNLLRL